ncbi:MAG: PhnA domain protein [Helicobacteraceae bacterium]|nr:PhnA domain protein [Helicobacteraceae bacterium]
MSVEEQLKRRSDSKCELCASEDKLSVYEVSPSDSTAEQSILLCATCLANLKKDELDENDWRCLSDSMWSGEAAVQVMAYRILSKTAQSDLLDQLYLEPEVQIWADAGISNEVTVLPRDSNGVELKHGDTVVVIKDLDVKGAGFTAKRGTAVRNISISDSEHIEGRVNGTKIVLKTCFLKKS